jgi:hypothetical protein
MILDSRASPDYFAHFNNSELPGCRASLAKFAILMIGFSKTADSANQK